MTTHDLTWFCEQIGKSRSWVLANLDDIPHHRFGRSVRFTDRDLTDYLEQTQYQAAAYMVTTGPKRRRSA